MIVLLGIYSSQASNEMSGYFQAYNIKNSNDVLILSIDNSTYKQGQTIFILGKVNNYNTVHTVISGKIYDNGTYDPDHLFKGGYIPPGDRLMASPTPGKYQYFCKLHPWLTGAIYVSSPPVPAKTSAKPNVAPKSFPVPDVTLTSIWNNRKDLQKLYPEVAKGNLTKLKNWAIATGWDQTTRLSTLIPKGKTPSYTDSILVSIWKDRKDLQKSYPEAGKGTLDGLMYWATVTGWNVDQRLSALIPPGKSP